MSAITNKLPEWALASQELYDAYLDFLFSREHICEKGTIDWYAFTLDKVMAWMVRNGVTRPTDITARHVRAYLSELTARGLKNSYVHNHARAIRTILIFFHEEKYTPERIKFQMPDLEGVEVRYFTQDEIAKLVKACLTQREKTVILVMVD
ncbi:MAG TPA: phage integrase N-terminal SAM-like domain-containing protein, partial [Anaerolineales bacterium]|nr:phage integrase N-terminal SAM-like domain-containing protein [Anaerolineales bacterium]